MVPGEGRGLGGGRWWGQRGSRSHSNKQAERVEGEVKKNTQKKMSSNRNSRSLKRVIFPFMLEQVSQWKVCAQSAGLEERQERGGRWWVKKLSLIDKGTAN